MKELSEQLTSQYKIKSKCPEKKTKNIAMRNHMLTYAKKDKILDAIRKNSIVIIQGSTGCGKSTQVIIDYNYFYVRYIHFIIS